MEFKLFNNDCLKILDKLIANNIQVDSIICDPPYGTTECEWDLVIPESELIPRLYEIIKPNGWLILFGNSPFYDKLLIKAIDKYNGKQLFKYSQEMIWEKHTPTNPLSANQQLMRKHEKIMILNTTKKEQGKIQTYNPYTRTLIQQNYTKTMTPEKYQTMLKTNGAKRNTPRSWIDLDDMKSLQHTNAYKNYLKKQQSKEITLDQDKKTRIVKTGNVENKFKIPKVGTSHLRDEKEFANKKIEMINNGEIQPTKEYIPYTNYPTSIFKCKHDFDKIHPTQKPLKLMYHLVKLFTNENDWVLDFTMGSGSTGVACIKNNRNFIGIELFWNS